MLFGHSIYSMNALVMQEQSEADYEKDRLRDEMADLKEQNVKMEGLVNFLEEEKSRLLGKLETTMAAGEQHLIYSTLHCY